MTQIRTILVSGSVPTVNQLALGDIAINTVDGKAFLKKYSGSVESIVEIGVSASYFSGSISNAISASYAATASSADSFLVRTGLTASGLNYPSADNGEFSFIQTDGNGNLSLQYVNTLYETIYNAEATTLTKGTPVYVSGSNGANSKVYRADAGIASKMPVIYISADNIASGDTGRGIALGLITGVDTTGYPAGTEVYVAVGGGWTSTRPTGSAIVQVLGIITKEGSGGQGVVLNPGPANLPNLLSGSIWVGNSGSVPAAVLTSSLSVAYAVSASNALTASYLNPLAQTVRLTGSLIITGSVIISSSATFINVGPAVFTGSAGTGSAVTVYKSGSTAFDIQGSSGQLFAVTDSLTGSLFSVNTAAGLPVIEAFSDNTVNIGKFGTYPIKVAATGTLAIITGSFTGSFTGSATTAVTASYALTSSFVNTLNQNVTITGDVSVLGTASINNLVVNQIGYSSGSNQLGDAASDTQTLYGSVKIPTGSLSVSGALQVSSSQTNYIIGSGFVGIGTTGPGYTLDVSGSIRATSYVYANDALVSNSLVSTGNTDLVLNKTTAYSILLNTAGVERMRVNAAGNVGIGTTVPQRRLHVDSSGSANTAEPLILTSIDTNNRVGILFASSSLSSGRQHKLYHRTTTSLVEWILGTNAGDNATWYLLPRDDTSYSFSVSTPYNGGTVYINTGINQPVLSLGAGGLGSQHINISASGNVGINTTTPTARFQVKGSGTTSATTAFRVENSSTTARLTILDDGTFAVNTSHFYISSSGAVGISTVAPAYTLEVNGPIYSSPGQLLLTASGSVNKEGAFIASSTGRTLQMGIFDNSVVPVGIDMFETNNSFPSTYLNFRVNNANLVRMTGSFVGIGTTSPITTLDVSGSGRFTNGIIVTGSTALVGAVTQSDAGNSLSSFQEILYLPVSIPGGGGAPTTLISKVAGPPMSMFIEYQIIDVVTMTDQRTGTIMANFNLSGTPTSTFTETVTADIGNTSGVVFTTNVGATYDIQATNSGFNPYTFKAILRYF